MTTEQQNLTLPEWTLGWRLQRSLPYAGITVDEMAEILGVSRSTISRWMHDGGVPKAAFLKQWALAVNLPLEWLLTGNVTPSSPGGDGVQQPIPLRRRGASGVRHSKQCGTLSTLLKAA